MTQAIQVKVSAEGDISHAIFIVQHFPCAKAFVVFSRAIILYSKSLLLVVEKAMKPQLTYLLLFLCIN